MIRSSRLDSAHESDGSRHIPCEGSDGSSFRYWTLRLFDLSPMMIILAVIGSLLAAFTLIIFGFLRVLVVIWELVSERDISANQEGQLSIRVIELIDIFLIGVILLIVALGLVSVVYRRKIDALPSWLKIHNLDELKHRVIGVVCVVLGVNFLSQVSEWTGGNDILYLGAAIGIVLVALVLLLKVVDDSIQEEVRMLREEHTLERDILNTEQRKVLANPDRPIVNTTEKVVGCRIQGEYAPSTSPQQASAKPQTGADAHELGECRYRRDVDPAQNQARSAKRRSCG